MKKTIAFILIICTLALCGCDKVSKLADELPPLPTAGDAVQSGQEQSIGEELVMINISRTQLEAYDPQQGTELILGFSYETPHVHIRGNVGAENRINEFVSLLDESFYTGDNYGNVYDSGHAPGYNNMLTSAEDNYNYIIESGAESMGFEFANHRELSVERSGGNVLSLLYSDYVYLGGAHPSHGERGYCFDTRTGELLSLETISADPAALKSFLTARMLSTAENDGELMARMEGFYTGTLEQALSALLRDGSWYFSDEGMVVFSDLYEISSYAAGPIVFTIPYAELSPYIKADYIPTPTDAVASLSVSRETAGHEILDMVKSDEEGETVYILVDGRAENVRVSIVEYYEAFYETAQLWRCSSMENCALQLYTMIPEGMPHIRISYTDAQGAHDLLLTQSGVDGSLILSEDSIQPVG